MVTKSLYSSGTEVRLDERGSGVGVEVMEGKERVFNRDGLGVEML
jgi:hypothetical protein